MRSFARFATIAVALGTSLTACASNRNLPRPDQPQTTLLVRNDNFLEHNVYLLVGSERIRLGTAGSNATSRFVIPSRYVFGVAQLQFLLDPIGGRRLPVSDQVSVSPGDEVDITIPASPGLRFSTSVTSIHP